MNDKTKAGLKIGGGCALAIVGVLAGLFGPKLVGDGQNEWEQAKLLQKAPVNEVPVVETKVEVGN